jgi:hypothetical protein
VTLEENVAATADMRNADILDRKSVGKSPFRRHGADERRNSVGLWELD